MAGNSGDGIARMQKRRICKESSSPATNAASLSSVSGSEHADLFPHDTYVFIRSSISEDEPLFIRAHEISMSWRYKLASSQGHPRARTSAGRMGPLE